MQILVCISHVPDTTTKVSVAADAKSLKRDGVKFILNPYDEFAIEEGLQLREKFGGSVHVITVGTSGAKDILRTALAMGADTAIHVLDEQCSDSYSVASSIAMVAKDLSPEMIICGRQSIDYDSYSMAPTIGALLGLASVSMVVKLTIESNIMVAERDIEGGRQTVQTSLPCVISVQKGINNPRYPKLPDIMKAKSKPIEERHPAGVAPRVESVEMTIPEQRRLNRILGDSDTDIDELVRLLHEEAKMI